MTDNGHNNGDRWGPRFKFVLIGFALIGAFFLIAEHRAHVLPWLPWLILAACPLMHLFMHHGHDDHDRHGGRDASAGSNAASGPGSTRQGPGSPESGGTAHHHH